MDAERDLDHAPAERLEAWQTVGEDLPHGLAGEAAGDVGGSTTIVAMTCMCVDGVSSAKGASGRSAAAFAFRSKVRAHGAYEGGPRPQGAAAAGAIEWMGWAYLGASLVGVVHVQRLLAIAPLAAPHIELLRGLVHVRAGRVPHRLAGGRDRAVRLARRWTVGGIVGLVIALALWAGLLGLQLVSGRSEQVMEDAQRGARAELSRRDRRLAERLAARVTTRSAPPLLSARLVGSSASRTSSTRRAAAGVTFSTSGGPRAARSAHRCFSSCTAAPGWWATRVSKPFR
jgi:hypothetical protein